MSIGLWVCCWETETVTLTMSVCERPPPPPPPRLCDHTQVKQMTFKQENCGLLLLTFLLREEVKNTPTEETVKYLLRGKVTERQQENTRKKGRGGERWRRWWRRMRRKWWGGDEASSNVPVEVWRDQTPQRLTQTYIILKIFMKSNLIFTSVYGQYFSLMTSLYSVVFSGGAGFKFNTVYSPPAVSHLD